MINLGFSKLKLNIIVSLLVTLLIGCKQEEKLPIVDNPINQDYKIINCSLEIDPGSTIVGKKLSAWSSIDEKEFSTSISKFELKIIEDAEFNIVFIGDRGSDKINMLGYVLAEDESPVFSSQSTAIALLMISPWAINLSVETKKELINKIPAHRNYSKLLAEVERLIANGQDVLTTKNTSLIAALQNFVADGIFKNNKSDGGLKFGFKGKDQLQIENSKAIAYAASLYDDEGKILPNSTLLIEGSEWVALNYINLLNFDYDIIGDPTLVDINFPESGNFNIKIENGWSLLESPLGKHSPEVNMAFRSNVISLISNIVGAFIPNLGPGALVEGKCFKSLIDRHWGILLNTLDITQADDNIDLYRGVINLLLDSSTGFVDIIEECSESKDPSEASKLRKWLGFILKVLDFTARVENGTNGGKLAYDWYTATTRYDLCFDVEKNVSIIDCSFRIINGTSKIIGVNICELSNGGALGSQFEHEMVFNAPVNKSIAKVRIRWYFTNCGLFAPSGTKGELITRIDRQVGNRVYYEDCVRFSQCGRYVSNISLIAQDGSESTTYEFEVLKPLGANKNSKNESDFPPEVGGI